MGIRHKVTKKTQTVTPEDWKTLQDEGYAKNFDVLSASDFSPPELTIPPVGTPAQEEKKDKTKV